ncbi:peripheral-type benzodiazepine receptor-associated protein 1-like [Spheniscus humboldti]
MRRDSAGWVPVARSCPSTCWGPAQAPVRPAKKEERRQELASPQIKPQSWLALQERPHKRHSAGQQATCQAVVDALLQVPEPAGKDLVLPGSACSQLLEQNARLQRALEDLERQRGALEMENCLLRKGSSPEACKEAERLQQKNAQLAALTEQLKERCRHLQKTIRHLMNIPVPLPIRSSSEEPCMKSFPQQRAGERRESAGVLLAQDQQNEVSQKAAEKLQTQRAADEEGSYWVSSLSQRCEQLEVQLLEMTDENTRLAEENSRLRGQMCWAEKVQAENADLKGQLTRVAEERNSVIQAIGSLQTQLEAAERKLKAVEERAESAQRDVKRDHGEARQPFRAQVAEDNWSVGERAGSTRGFISSGFAEEDSDDDLENEDWDDPRYYIFGLSPIVEEDEEDLDVGDGG